MNIGQHIELLTFRDPVVVSRVINNLFDGMSTYRWQRQMWNWERGERRPHNTQSHDAHSAGGSGPQQRAKMRSDVFCDVVDVLCKNDEAY